MGTTETARTLGDYDLCNGLKIYNNRKNYGSEVSNLKVNARIFYILVTMLILVSCTGKKEDIIFRQIYTDKYIDNTKIDIDAKIIEISKYLKSYEFQGDIEKNLTINIIDGYDELTKLGIELVSVKLDYAWLDGFVVYRNNELIGLLYGMNEQGVYMTDLNNDGNMEIIYQSEFGSGISRTIINLLDLGTNKVYSAQYYNNNDGIIFDVTPIGVAVYSYYYEFERRSEEPIGYLKLTEEGLVIDGVDAPNLQLMND
ncbi:MAG: hypothetical protein CVU98_00770 [Firmicutes bacterium HGW-Firmicutes-3]|jgi:hypothetical protein|nr:MAG: hypothetical protein CVU98_00770 [Firmicutes bacterium HGW-Firmicutes-3]